MKPAHSMFALILACGIAQTAAAAGRDPGLWEFKTKAQVEGQPQAGMPDLSKIPPEQRAQVEAMMAQRGMSIGADGMTIKMCVTPEQAARDDSYQPRHAEGANSDCKSTHQRSGDTITFESTCTKPRPMKSSGKVTISGSKSFSGYTDSETPAPPRKTHVEFSGRWLSSDCQGIKPLGQ